MHELQEKGWQPPPDTPLTGTQGDLLLFNSLANYTAKVSGYTGITN